MTPFSCLALACAGFVGTHFLLSHPLRAPLVARLGERGFAILYTVVALLTFGAVIYAFPRANAGQAPLWMVDDAGWIIASLLMWFGSILFAGSLRRNPAFPRPGKRIERIDGPRGIFAITRHPMNWGFASWGIVHAMVHPTPAGLTLSAAIVILALGGSVGQDSKKERLLGAQWRDWKAKAAFFPFGRGFALPDLFSLIAGTILFLVATWAHGALGGMAAGPWRWLA